MKGKFFHSAQSAVWASKSRRAGFTPLDSQSSGFIAGDERLSYTKSCKNSVLRVRNLTGFTLLELLIVIGIIAILAAVAYVALNPQKRFADARDARRYSDVSAILSAIKIDQVDNGGTYLSTEITGLTDDIPYMIGTETSCTTIVCADVTIANNNCVSLVDLATEGYLSTVPFAPPVGTTTYSEVRTGYTVTRKTNGSITVQACDSENQSSISISR